MGLCTLALLGGLETAPAQATDWPVFHVRSGSVNCNSVRHAVLHAIGRGRLVLLIDSSRAKYVNHSALTQDNLAGDYNLTSWDWYVDVQNLEETTPDDYLVTDAWPTCVFD